MIKTNNVRKKALVCAKCHSKAKAKNPTDISIAKYKKTRFWAVWMKKELIAVVCYKKGAHAIRDVILNNNSSFN